MRTLCLIWKEENTHTCTNKSRKEYKKHEGQGMARGGGFYFAFYIFLNPGLSDSKATHFWTVTAGSCHPQQEGGPVQFQHTSHPF